ncbi:uncharacterized protein I206_107262 [Kwoniella pini CBS 10737]|uniref:5'-nucleotidase n=1 Tax=Kwoniella pini CBS 10737 TaxID=1296096 RepID=A0A1B9HYR8_9TREE|nr:uncharacterized protein I206_05193 [Kwoniella pini CBS 10737]OCF48416.1 hypothetical protein I206_05193 [Kwoniella pini CBS 10737]
MPSLPILCFNDVYRVSQKYNAQPGAPDDKSGGTTINVSQFAQLLFNERNKWPEKSSSTSLNGSKGKEKETEKDGLVLFAGDVFNPSVESSISRGSHMVPLLNALELDVACVGNHDFDFGYPHLTKLIESTSFPWLLSNIIDERTGSVPDTLNRFWITERCGLKIGVIGLVEQDWIATIPSWPKSFKYRPMKEVALELSKELRDPNGPHKVDLIIALTHCRVPNDIRLCNELGAVANKDGVENEHGVDLLIGGHDHIYYIGKGNTSWEGYSGRHDAPGTTEDKGVRLIKSGTDFRDLTSAVLELTPTREGSIRRHIITDLKGKHLYVLPSSPSSDSFDSMVKSLLASVSEAIQKPVCFTLSPFDARSEIVRTQENGLGNWIADVLLHAYAESLFDKGKSDEKGVAEDNERMEGKCEDGADAVIICGGTLRGDSQYGPGKITLGDILEILPFEDPVVCLEIDGKGIWDTFEGALSKWPAQEGRFPIISGLVVKWDHTRPPNQRVISIHQLKRPIHGKNDDDNDEEEDEIEDPRDFVDFKEQEDGTRVVVKQKKLELGDEVKNDESRIYRVITREYMALGYDGFDALKNRKFVVDDENGQIMSSILRSFLLGSSYIFRHKQLESAAAAHLSSRTDKVLSRARNQHQHSPTSSVSSSPQSTKSFLSPQNSHHAAMQNSGILSPVSERSTGSAWGVLKRHVVQHDWSTIRDALHVAKNEHMSSVDEVAGQAMRQQKQAKPSAPHMPGQWESRSTTPLPIPDSDKPAKGAQNDILVNQEKRELDNLSDDLAIVCPLIDGRMKDVSADKD